MHMNFTIKISVVMANFHIVLKFPYCFDKQNNYRMFGIGRREEFFFFFTECRNEILYRPGL